MPDFAKNVTLDLDQSKLFVDGTEFPWSVAAIEDGMEVTVDTATRTSTVRVAFFAEAITVIPVADTPA